MVTHGDGATWTRDERDVFDVLFCFGEEEHCSFAPALLAYSIGWTGSRFERACLSLQEKGVMTYSRNDKGDAYAQSLLPLVPR